jgi:hypothetical protein
VFVVERRIPSVCTADLATLQGALVFACKRLTSEVSRCAASTAPPTACLSSSTGSDYADHGELNRVREERHSA